MDNPDGTDHIDQSRHFLRDLGDFQEMTAEERLLFLRLGILLSLFDRGGPQEVDLLLENARQNSHETVQRLAYRLLTILATEGNLSAQNNLSLLFLFDENQEALDTALKQQYAPTDPPLRAAFLLLSGQTDVLRQFDKDYRLLTRAYESAAPDLQNRMISAGESANLQDWCGLVKAVYHPTADGFTWLVKNLPVLPDEPLRALGLDLLVAKSTAGDEDMLSCLVDLWILSACEPARDALLAGGLIPKDAGKRALFYLLTDQWQAYQALDFNQSMLALSYAAADAQLRRRIVTQTRRAGRVDWMQAIVRGRQVRWLSEMDDTDWVSIIDILSRESQWDDLWRLAQVAPPIWSVPILARLRETGWTPATDRDRRGFDQLYALVEHCQAIAVEAHSPHSFPPQPVEISCLDISPGGSLISAGTNRNGILAWRLPDEKHPQVIATPPGPVWSLVFSPNGKNLASGHSDHAIRVWDTQSQRLIKTLEGHTAMVRSLQITPDERLMVSASFDGSIRIWRFPLGPELEKIAEGLSELFALSVSPDGLLLAGGGADGCVRTFSLPKGNLISTAHGHSDTVTCLVFHPNGSMVFSGSRDQTVRVWSAPEGIEMACLEGHASPVTALSVHPNGKLLASAGFDGRILLWSVPKGTLIQAIEPHTAAVTGLKFSPDWTTLLCSTREGLILRWDLRPLLWIRLPIERLSPKTLLQLNEALSDKSLSSAERAWLGYCRAQIQWQHQFDIELAENPPIHTGEFDIEISD